MILTNVNRSWIAVHGRQSCLYAVKPRICVWRSPITCCAKLHVKQACTRKLVHAPCTKEKRLAVIAAAAAEEELRVLSETVDSCRRKLTVTVPASMTKECFETTVKNLRKTVGTLPGFRPEKIPLNVIVQNVGGQRNFKLTIIEEILLQTMPLVMEKIGEPVVPESERVADDINELEQSFDPSKPFTYKIEFDTTPPITWTKSYKDIHITIKDTGNRDTDIAAVEDLLRQYRKEKGGYQSVVVGRGLQRGDACIMEIEVRSKGSKLPLPGLKQRNMRFDTEKDPLSLTEGMLGMKQGEQRQFDIRFPDDYSIELWQGMEAEVIVKLKELFAWNLPAFDDEYVKQYFPNFSSAEDMRKNLLAATAMERMKELDKQLEDIVLTEVLKCLSIPEVPEKLVIDMGTTQYRATLMQMIEDRIGSPEDIEKLSTPEMVEEYITKRQHELEDLVKFNLAVDDIFAAEGLTLDDTDINSEYDLRKHQYEAQNLEYDPDILREQVKETFKHVRVIEWLKDTVQRTVIPWESS